MKLERYCKNCDTDFTCDFTCEDSSRTEDLEFCYCPSCYTKRILSIDFNGYPQALKHRINCSLIKDETRTLILMKKISGEKMENET